MSITRTLAHGRQALQWRLVEAGIPCCLIATEVETLIDLAIRICYQYKTPFTCWLFCEHADLRLFARELERAALSQWD
jgi:hypothetical protein